MDLTIPARKLRGSTLKIVLLKISVNTWITIMPTNTINYAAINLMVRYSLFRSLPKPSNIIYLTLL